MAIIFMIMAMVISTPKFPVPAPIAGTTSQIDYDKWLNQKSWSLLSRDKRRNRPYAMTATRQVYKQKIHEAAATGNAIVDPYTGDTLRWDLLHKWDPKKDKGHKNFEKAFYRLPSVDHRYPDSDTLDLEICSWLINSCKSDQSPEDFVKMCRTIVEYRSTRNHSGHPFLPGRSPQIYFLPPFLEGICTEAVYRKWLFKRAHQLYVRDCKEGRPYALAASNALYQMAIHAAVLAAGLYDPFTGERMKWELLGTWDSSKGKSQSDAYDSAYCLMPTVDHIDPFGDKLEFEICSWRINCCKSGLTPDEFVEVCRKVATRNTKF
jgi:hypothetical protein